MDIKQGWLLWFTNFLIKSPGVANNEIKQNLQLAGELHKPIIKNFKKTTVYPEFKDNIWGADLADVQLISKLNKGFRFLLCISNLKSKVDN